MATAVFSQGTNGTIKGKVTTLTGPLANATVIVQGTNYAAQTDTAGRYSLTVPAGTYTLTASYVGYKAVDKSEVKLNNGQQVQADFQLSGDQQLQEVVVSYGRQRSRDITGSVATVNAGPLQDMPVQQFAQQLQGKVAGVQVSQVSGQPGRGMAFRIRGAASLNSSNQPLFVIDGAPVTGSINNINPAEIETFTVLKDASATALYGSRAANGVVLITTKHAKSGADRVDFNGFYGMQAIPEKRVSKPMTAQQFAQFMKQRFEDKATYEGYTGGVPAEYQHPEQLGEGTNWYKLLTRKAPTQSYDVTFQSAREKSSSLVMIGYQAQDGVLINSGTKLFTMRLNQDFTLMNGKLKAGFNLAPSYRIDHNNRLSTDGLGGLFEQAFEASPLVAPYDSLGNYNKFTSSSGMVSYINPLANFNLRSDDYYTTRILGNGFVNYEIIDGLFLKANVAIDKGAETRKLFAPSLLSTISMATGTSSSVDNYSWTTEINLDYKRKIAEDHTVQALVGYSAQRFTQLANSLDGTGFPLDDVGYLSAATSISGGNSTNTKYSLLSEIARLNYDYKGKYLLQGAIRRDGSSRFGANTKYGYFPSVSVGWIASDEHFLSDNKLIDFLKLRASYGITGNNFFNNNFAAQTTIGQYNYILSGSSVPGLAFSNLGNPDLQWERNKQFDVGLDLTMLNNRIRFTYDYYHKITDGMIQARPVPRASGFTSVMYNIGEFEFWGHEFTLGTQNLSGVLNWSTDVNISFDRNVIKKLVSPGFIRRNNTVSSDYFRNQVGHHLGEFYGFVFEGLYKDEADLKNSAQYGALSDVGTIKVKDINGDGVIDDVNDRTFIGDPTPDFSFGMTNDLSYKNFDLNITLAGAVGGDLLNSVKWSYQSNMDGSRVPIANVLDYWRSPENPGSGIYPRTKTNTTVMGRQVNSQWVENGSYLTAKNITLGYSFQLPKSSLLSRLRLYATVQQAFIITGYSGLNPEISLNGLDPTQGIGVDENAYPVPRTYALGLSVSFK